MTIPVKTLSTHFAMPALGIGTWQMGGRMERDPNNDDAANEEGIKSAIEMGVTHIDTAENYALGKAEELVGKAIKSYEREKLFITTKVGKIHLRYDEVLAACNNSLSRLQTNYLDLYLIHAPNDDVPIEETMKAMDKLVADGLVKHIGVSNFKTQRLIETQKLTKNKIVTNQVFYNLVEREPEKEGLLEYCQNNDVLLTAYRPLEKGMLLENLPEIVDQMAKKYEKTPAQIMLNWLISQKNVVVIAKMEKLNHIKENLGALDWQMEKEDIEKLRSEYPNQIARPEALPLI